MATSFGTCTEISWSRGALKSASQKSCFYQVSQCRVSIDSSKNERVHLLSMKSGVAGARRSRVKAYSVRAEKGKNLTYKESGVDIDAGSELVRRIAKMAPGIGGFGGLFPLGMICYCYLPYNTSVSIT